MNLSEIVQLALNLVMIVAILYVVVERALKLRRWFQLQRIELDWIDSGGFVHCIRLALRNAIQDHGPITLEFENSAVKRIKGETRPYLREMANLSRIVKISQRGKRKRENRQVSGWTLRHRCAYYLKKLSEFIAV